MDRKARSLPFRFASGIGLLACALGLPSAFGQVRQTAGKYQVTLRLPPGGLYAQEETQIEFRVEDTSRPDPLAGYTAVVRATPEAVIDMPAMPGMPKFTETAHAEGAPGDYGIHPTFAHGGEFRLRLGIQPPEGERFTVDFPLSVLDAGAAKRKPAPPRYTLELTTQPGKAKAGQPVELRLAVHDRERANATVSAFDIAHEKPLHLVIVRRDLSQFAHEHPTLTADGSFHLRWTFPVGGDYRLFADVAPKGAGSQILNARINVAGAPQSLRPASCLGNLRQTPLVPAASVELESSPEELPVRKTVAVVLTVRDSRTGAPVANLEPYLGAMGHLMLVHEDASTFVHSHPDESGPGESRLRFLARFPKPGLYRGWVQFQRDGEVLTADILFHAGSAVE